MVSFTKRANNPWGPPHALNTFDDVKKLYDEIIAHKQVSLIPTIVGHHSDRPDIVKLEPLEALILEAKDVATAVSFCGHPSVDNYNCSRLEHLIIEYGTIADLLNYISRVNKVSDADAVCHKVLFELENGQGNFNNFYKINNALAMLNRLLPNESKKPIVEFILRNISRIGLNLNSLFTTLPWLDMLYIYGEYLKLGVEASDSLALIHLWIQNYQKLPLEPLLKFMQKISDHYSIYKLVGELAERDNIPKPTALLQTEYADDIGVLHQLFDNEFPDFNVQQYQSLIQQQEDIDQIEKIWKDPRFDANLFQSFLVEKNLAHLAVQWLKQQKENPNINIPLMQTLVESSNDSALMQRFVELDFKFNFKLFKNKYNNIIEKGFKDGTFDKEKFIEAAYEMGKFQDGPDLDDYKEFIKHLVDKKEWYFLTRRVLDIVDGSGFITTYRQAKGKSRLQIFNEGFRQNYSLVGKCRRIQDYHSHGANRREFMAVMYGDGNIWQIIPEQSNNIDQFVKFYEKGILAAELLHNGEATESDLVLAVLNPQFRIEDKSNQELLDSFQLSKKLEGKDFSSRLDEVNAKTELINKESFLESLQIFKSLHTKFTNKEAISFQRGTPEYDALKKVHVGLTMLDNFKTIKKYVNQAKPKDPKLNDFNAEMPEGYRFRVLRYLDPYAFQVGADTDCCQRIGGAGESAAIDSFINPLAGVLLLEHNDRIVSQSYFHYVPEQNGLILDNVESNSSYMQKLKLNPIDLSKIYADYAAVLKARMPELAYVKCGKNYNKLANEMFASTTMENDPRHFASTQDKEDQDQYGYDDSDDVYSDFDEDDHLDLLQPTEGLRKVKVPDVTAAAHDDMIYLTARFVRRYALSTIASS